MAAKGTSPIRRVLVWGALAIAILVPLGAAALSPQLAWRGPVYISAGFAGIVVMALLLVQPLLVGGYLPGLSTRRERQIHRVTGGVLVAAVIFHVAALWVTSPPDVIDVLLFRSPTPFSAWGALAMWAVFAAALLAAFRRRLKLRPRNWRLAHGLLVSVAVLCSALHALLIEGTMETVSKAALCALTVLATAKVIADLRIWSVRR